MAITDCPRRLLIATEVAEIPTTHDETERSVQTGAAGTAGTRPTMTGSVERLRVRTLTPRVPLARPQLPASWILARLHHRSEALP